MNPVISREYVEDKYIPKEDLDFIVEGLTEIIDLVGGINLTTTFKQKNELNKLHKSFDLLLKLRKKVHRKIDRSEEEDV